MEAVSKTIRNDSSGYSQATQDTVTDVRQGSRKSVQSQEQVSAKTGTSEQDQVSARVGTTAQDQVSSKTGTSEQVRTSEQANDSQTLSNRKSVERANIGFAISFSVRLTGVVPSGRGNC